MNHARGSAVRSEDQGSARNLAMALWTHLGLESTLDSLADDQAFAALLRQARDDYGIRPIELAEEIGASLNDISDAITMGREPLLHDRAQIIEGVRSLLKRKYQFGS